MSEQKVFINSRAYCEINYWQDNNYFNLYKPFPWLWYSLQKVTWEKLQEHFAKSDVLNFDPFFLRYRYFYTSV